MRRALVVDDLRLLRERDGVELVYARNSTTALQLLREEGWDELWLDHDLGGDDTTMAVVLELEAAAHGAAEPVSVGAVYVHTDNVVGGDRIVAALQRHYPVRRVPARDVTTGTIAAHDQNDGTEDG